MAQKPIREYYAKRLISTVWPDIFGNNFNYAFESALISKDQPIKEQEKTNPWLKDKSLVVKPDMLFGKRGKNNLVYLKKSKVGDVKMTDAAKWIEEKSNNETTLSNNISGYLTHFIVEPFVPHDSSEEYYVSMTSEEYNDIIYVSAFGGINVEENWDKVNEIKISISKEDTDIKDIVSNNLPKELVGNQKFTDFVCGLYKIFRDNFFTYLEINPVVIKGQDVYLLDMVAKVDDTAGFLMKDLWKDMDFPLSFGHRVGCPEEKMIEEIDEKSGASLKLTVLNPQGLIWTLVAGGGASVVYADTIADFWSVDELANYGEYSGNPTTEETYIYAKTVLDLMTREKDAQGRDKILLIGGAIANFTDVAKTFLGIIQAFNEMSEKMKKTGVKIYVRRGGPNHKIGLENIKKAAESLGLSIKVFDSSHHMTDIVKLAQEESVKEPV